MELFANLIDAVGYFLMAVLFVFLLAATFRWSTKRLADNIERNQSGFDATIHSMKLMIDSLLETSQKHDEANKQFAKTNEYLMGLGKASKDRDEAQNQILHELIAANNINRGKCESHLGVTTDHGRRILIIENTVTGIAKHVNYHPKPKEDVKPVDQDA